METKQKIIDTYKILVRENKTADISVAEICRRTEISRKTFYNYFKDRYELLEKIMFDEIEKPLLQGIKQGFTYNETIYLVFENLLLEKNFYKIALMEDCQNSLFDSLTECLSKIIAQCNDRTGFTEEEIEFINYKYAALMVMLIRKWIKSGMKQSPEFMRNVVMYPKE